MDFVSIIAVMVSAALKTGRAVVGWIGKQRDSKQDQIGIQERAYRVLGDGR